MYYGTILSIGLIGLGAGSSTFLIVDGFDNKSDNSISYEKNKLDELKAKGSGKLQWVFGKKIKNDYTFGDWEIRGLRKVLNPQQVSGLPFLKLGEKGVKEFKDVFQNNKKCWWWRNWSERNQLAALLNSVFERKKVYISPNNRVQREGWGCRLELRKVLEKQMKNKNWAWYYSYS